MPDLAPFPDPERALGDLLADLGTTGNKTTVTLQDTLPYIRIRRTGGSDDEITDSATVSADVFAADADAAKALAERIRARLISGPFAGTSFRTGHGVIDRAATAVAPQLIPATDSANLALAVASYRITMRRQHA